SPHGVPANGHVRVDRGPVGRSIVSSWTFPGGSESTRRYCECILASAFGPAQVLNKIYARQVCMEGSRRLQMSAPTASFRLKKDPRGRMLDSARHGAALAPLSR